VLNDSAVSSHHAPRGSRRWVTVLFCLCLVTGTAAYAAAMNLVLHRVLALTDRDLWGSSYLFFGAIWLIRTVRSAPRRPAAATLSVVEYRQRLMGALRDALPRSLVWATIPITLVALIDRFVP
jgi:hypothetical protein